MLSYLTKIKLFHEVSPQQKQIYFKLIALWVICEAMLGGIIHGFKLQISGLVIGGSAVVCISLIGHLLPFRGAILKATIVVAIFKMLLSPQSPFPAYIAVLFQGICGELIFSGRKNYKARCYLLAFLALIESAFQRILVMTILFGVDFWQAVNEFIIGLTHTDPGTNYSLYFVLTYVALHFIAAFFIGRFASSIPKLLSYSTEELQSYMLPLNTTEISEINKPKKKSLSSLVLIWFGLIAIFVYTLIYPQGIFASVHASLKFIFRSAIILLTWYLIFAPILLHLLKSWLEKRKGTYKKEIEEVILLLPSAKILIRESWKKSGVKNGYSRLKLFWKYLIINTVFTPIL